MDATTVAEAEDRHGMRRFRLRGLERVNAEALLVAAGQNVKRLLAYDGRSPRRLVKEAALRPPGPAQGADPFAPGGTSRDR